MNMKLCLSICTIAVLAVFTANAAGGIPDSEVDEEKVLVGIADSFSKAAEVDYFAIVKATPQYREITKNKIEPGTAKYFILMSEAGDKAIRIISEAAEAEGYDLVTQKGYLGSLSKPISAANITKSVLELMQEDS